MSPPIEIDGTDITGATIDGTDVQEITVDGQTVFTAEPPLPSSAFLQFDASQMGLSNNATVNTLTDFVGSNDASANGSPTFVTNGLNGKPVIRYDLSDTHGTGLTTISQPFTAITVFNNFLVDGNNHRLWARSSSSQPSTNVYMRFSNDWYMFAGGGSGLDSGTTVTSGIFVCIFDGSNSEFRHNGTIIATGDPGSNSLGGVEMAGENGASFLLGEYDLAEHLFYDADLRSTGEVLTEESRLSNKWGFSV